MSQLISQYQRPVFNAAYRILGNKDDAADATQVVFLKVFEHIADYDPEFKFFSWIYRIAINESLNQVKKRRKQESLADSQASPWRGPAEELDSARLSSRVQAALMQLNEDYRTVVVLKHISGCSYQQIGEILQLPEKTVKSRLYSARQLMKKALQHDEDIGAGNHE
ncbi:MAG: sigma-70 family RNA polymerase sigma factor [Xanthomonadales bacterium]|nr:sigma-70 family RNA polymerase sigma factor [Xanthomonadales bacterium]